MSVPGRMAWAMVPVPARPANARTEDSGTNPSRVPRLRSTARTDIPAAWACRRNATRFTPASGVRSTRTRPCGSRIASAAWSIFSPWERAEPGFFACFSNRPRPLPSAPSV